MSEPSGCQPARASPHRRPGGPKPRESHEEVIVLIAAIVAVVGLGTAVAVGKETTKVGASVSMKFTGVHPSESGTFVGKVKARGLSEAAQGRFLLERAPLHTLAGANRSKNRGRYRIDPKNVHGHAVEFWVEVENKIIENDGEKIVCKKARSKGVLAVP